MKLFIFGNGFDIAHGFQTRYSNFKCFLQKRVSETYDDDVVPEIPGFYMGHHDEAVDEKELTDWLMWLINDAIEDKTNWNDFERALADLNMDRVYSKIIEDADFIDPVDKEGDRDYGAYREIVDEKVKDVEKALGCISDVFSEWISQVELNTSAVHQKIGSLFNNNDLYLTFNYTETLEMLYGVSADKIWHIHGMRHSKYGKGSRLIIGHGGKETDLNYHGEIDNEEIHTNERHNEYVDDVSDDYEYEYEDDDEYEDDENSFSLSELDHCVSELKKDTNKCILDNISFFECLSAHGRKMEITDIYSFGFSFSQVDLIYIRQICACLNGSKNITWYLNKFDNADNDEFEKRISNCGFKGKFGRYD